MDEWIGNLLSYVTDSALIIAIIAGVGYIFRGALSEWIAEKVTSKFRTELARLESELRSSEARMSDLRNHLLSISFSRSTILTEKKIDALDTIWKSVCELSVLNGAVKSLQVVNFTEAERNLSDPAFQAFAQQLGGFFADPENIKRREAQPDRLRPYVPEMLWLSFVAYRSIMFQAFLVWNSWKNGVSAKKLLKMKSVMEDVSLILPHQVPFFEKYGDDAVFFVTEELEAKILSLIRIELIGDVDDALSAEKARRVVEQGSVQSNEPEIARRIESAKKGLPEQFLRKPL